MKILSGLWLALGRMKHFVGYIFFSSEVDSTINNKTVSIIIIMIIIIIINICFSYLLLHSHQLFLQIFTVYDFECTRPSISTVEG